MSCLTLLGLARHKCLWVWQDVRLNSLELGYVLDLVVFGPRGMLDLISLGYYLLIPQLCKTPQRADYMFININADYKG